jgi:protoporphyrinogen oxidase
MGRVQNYKAWSPEMVPDPNFCCYGLEYFCFAGDELWTSSDADLIALGTRELEQVGLCKAADVVDGCVMRHAQVQQSGPRDDYGAAGRAQHSRR